ncbi:MAG: NHL repeat-containing protein [Planctomycetaceae bacterium]|nr:NHL repeat-containing protein [Planctomycetaceae bacterium]
MFASSLWPIDAISDRRWWMGLLLAWVPGTLTAQEAAAPTKFVYPLASAVAPDGAIYIADRNLPGVWKYADGQLSVLFHASKKFRTPLNAVRCVAIDHEGRLLAGDSSTREIYRFDANGKPQPLTNGGIGIPMAMAVAADGTIYAADLEIQRVVAVPPEGGEPRILAQITGCRGLALAADGKLWAVSNGGSDVLLKMDPTAETPAWEVVLGGQPFQFPAEIAVLPSGVAYVADGYAKTIWKVEPGQVPQPAFQGELLQHPVGLVRHKEGLLVTDPRAATLFELSAVGELMPLVPAPGN